MSRWSSRWIILGKSGKLVYKVQQSDAELKAEYDLSPGCIVTDIVEEKKMYSFWVVWPYDKRNPLEGDEVEGDGRTGDVSVTVTPAAEAPADSTSSISTGNDGQLRRMLEKKIQDNQMEKTLVSQQLERHVAHDNTVGMIPTVAGVVAGGVVVGVLTLGVGLIPYLTIVGGVVVAGGGTLAYHQYRKPADSRLILAFSSKEEAAAWRSAISEVILKVEKRRDNPSPMLTHSSHSRSISRIYRLLHHMFGRGNSKILSSCWVHVRTIDTVRVMQLRAPPGTSFDNIIDKELLQPNTIVRHSMTMARNTTLASFLGVMEGGVWPKGGSLDVVHAIDDHTDIIRVHLHPPNDDLTAGEHHTLFLSRYWRLDEDGVYVVTFNTLTLDEVVALTKKNGEELDTSADVKFSLGSGSAKSNRVYIDHDHDPSTDNDADCDTDYVEVAHHDSVLKKIFPLFWRKSQNVRHGDGETPIFGAVVSISPRKDYAEYDNDVPLCLINCIACAQELSQTGAPPRRSGQGHAEFLWEYDEASKVVDDFLIQHVCDLTKHVQELKFAESSTSSSTDTTLGPLVEEDTASAANFYQIEANDGGIHSAENTMSPSSFSPAKDLLQHLPRRRLPKLHLADLDGGDGSIELKAMTSRSRTTSFARSRSISVNSEAAALRGQVAAKEYELQRLEVVARRRNDPASQEAVMLMQHQMQELHELKQSYLDLTGSPYDQSHSKLYPPASSVHAVGSGRNLCGGKRLRAGMMAGMMEEVKGVPVHWAPSLSNTVPKDVRTESNRFSNGMIFLIVITCSIFLANLLSFL
jgi:hypothetical protein